MSNKNTEMQPVNTVHCPFCGFNFIRIGMDTIYRWQAVCKVCGARGPTCDDSKQNMDAAVEKWNGRKQPVPLNSENAR